MGRTKDDYEYYELALRLSDISGIDGALKGICEKVRNEGTAQNLSPAQRAVLDNAQISSYLRELSEDQEIDDYVNYQREKDD